MRHLAESWLRTAAAVGARGDVAGAGANLLARWAEPHRRYHDLAHLDAVLRNVDLLSSIAVDVGVDVDEVRLGAWFHDAAYDPTAPDNEPRSALLAEKVLTGLRVPAVRIAEVVRLVALTAGHDPAEDDQNGAVLCDADLAVLAGGATAYERYAEAVRAEYAHLGDHAFRQGRAGVLRALLDRPALFRTDHGRTTWETQARANVRHELDLLET
jgi:predicted metal-dependent HD superfamily phosphohydrolase